MLDTWTVRDARYPVQRDGQVDAREVAEDADEVDQCEDLRLTCELRRAGLIPSAFSEPDTTISYVLNYASKVQCNWMQKLLKDDFNHCTME